MLKLQFLTGKKHNEEWSTVKNCNFSKLQFFKCTFTVISLHIFAVWFVYQNRLEPSGGIYHLYKRNRLLWLHVNNKVAIITEKIDKHEFSPTWVLKKKKGIWYLHLQFERWKCQYLSNNKWYLIDCMLYFRKWERWRCWVRL